MNKETIILQASAYARQELESDSSGHDWWHIVRVACTARRLAEEEQADLFVCELAALLHDVADEKLNSSAEEGMSKVRDWLEDHDVDEDTAGRVLEIIATISYKGGHNRPVTTKEAQIVQDADRLDALGAIGIARTFAYAGWKGHRMYDPERPLRTEVTYEEYRKGEASAIHHFYEKLFKLADLMNTDSGRRWAKSRHRFMEQYLEQFYHEWNGADS